MKYKEKLILLSLLLSLTSYGAIDIDGVYVNGSNTVERVEGEYTLSSGTGSESKPINNIAVVENGGTLDNWGTISSSEESYETEKKSVLGLIGFRIENPLKKSDCLLRIGDYLDGSAPLKQSFLDNNGIIRMSGTIHTIKTPLINLLDGVLGDTEASYYTQNTIELRNSVLENSGIIEKESDKIFRGSTGILGGLLKANVFAHIDTNYTKNLIQMYSGSKLTNYGELLVKGDYDIQYDSGILDIADIKLLSNFNYVRNKTTVNTDGRANIINEANGNITVEGDILTYKEGSWLDKILEDGLINLSVITDFSGENKKTGVNLTLGGTFTNRGSIVVERDYKKGVNALGQILNLTLIYKDLVGAGLLEFESMKETSIGVALANGATFNNEGGSIEVGVNKSKNILGTEDLFCKAIAIQADNSTINFENGKIYLEGHKAYATDLNSYSTITYGGDNYIYYRSNDVEGDIFSGDGSGKVTIEGSLTVDGLTEEVSQENTNGTTTVVTPSEQFNANLTIDKDSNVYLRLGKNEDGNYAENFGSLNVTGNLKIENAIKIDGTNLVGADLTKYVGNTIVSAGGGISGDTNITSDSFMFTVDTINTPNTIEISNLTRKDFNEIVTNNQLATIFEISYDNANAEQLQVYKILAQGSNVQEFNQIVDEVTGKDTLTTLNSQIYDITKDLNKQFKDFAKTNTQDGVVFKYINSKSELGANSSTVGFERESSGIMLGYNNYISEKLRLGAGFSYMKSDIDYTSASSNDITTWNFRGYSDYNLGFANIFSDLSFGYNRAENKRVAEQISYTGIKEGDLDVYSLSLNNSLYKGYQFNDKLSLTTSLNLDFTYLYQEDFEENGILGATADSTNAFYVTTGLGVDGKYNLISFGNSKVNLIAGMEYSYDIVSSTEDMNLKISAFDPYYKESSRELDKKSLTYDIGLNYEYSDRYSIGVKYTKELMNDIDNDQYGIDFTYKF